MPGSKMCVVVLFLSSLPLPSPVFFPGNVDLIGFLLCRLVMLLRGSILPQLDYHDRAASKTRAHLKHSVSCFSCSFLPD